MNVDPVTGSFDPMAINPEMGLTLRGRKLNRRDFCKLSVLALAAAAGCTPQGQRVVKTAEALATLDTDAVATRVSQLEEEDKKATEGARQDILNTPETGIYNQEALRRWTELEQQPPIDQRIGISILPSRYVRGEGSIIWHTDVAAKLGFQRVAIPISPPEFVGHTGIQTANTSTLDTLVGYNEFDYLFRHPNIKAIHITCDVGNSRAANGWQFKNENPYTPEQLQLTYDEYRRTADIILKRYGHLDKDITFGGPNEMELLVKGPYNGATEDDDLPPQAVEKAIIYFNTVYRAVCDANSANSDKKPLLTGIEVLQIRSEFKSDSAVTGLDVIDGLDVPPDESTLSCWQFSANGEGGYWPQKAMEKVKSVTPGAVAITEYGVADGDRPDLSRDSIAGFYTADIQGAFGGGAKYVTVWGLTCFNSKGDINFPDNNQVRGLGLIRPDGSIRREVYEAIRDLA